LKGSIDDVRKLRECKVLHQLDISVQDPVVPSSSDFLRYMLASIGKRRWV